MINKKTFTLILTLSLIILCILLFSAGCGQKQDAPGTGNAADDSAGALINTEITDKAVPAAKNIASTAESGAKKDGFVFIYNNIPIYLGDYMENVLNKLGPELNYSETASCTSDGIMKTYSYSGVEITTYVKDTADKDIIYSVTFDDDSVSTAEGICIGKTVADMTAAYGKASDEMTGFYYRYEKNGTILSFDVDGDTIISVTYQANITA